MGYIYTKSGKLAKRLYFGAVLLFEGLYYTFKNRVLADGGTFVENELPTISQDAKLVLTPNAYKAGKLYSAVPNDGTGDFTVDRNSTATFVDEDGLIKTALANVPRIDYSTGEAALLMEPQSTNLINYSEDFSNAYWEKLGSTVVGGQSAPSADTPTGAFKLVEDTSTGNHLIKVFSIFTTDGEDRAWSLRVKNNGRRYVVISHVHTFNNDINNVVFDTQLGVYTTEGESTWTDSVIPLKQMPDGWWEIGFVSDNNDSSYDNYFIGLSSTGDMSGASYEGDGSSGIYIYGAQIEQGSTASSYIPTAGVTETRLADNISVPTPAGVTSITETIDGVEQTPITTIPATYSLPVGNINKVTML